jgi:hypothetical protein
MRIAAAGWPYGPCEAAHRCITESCSPTKFSEINFLSPASLGARSVNILVYVEDVDVFVLRTTTEGV